MSPDSLAMDAARRHLPGAVALELAHDVTLGELVRALTRAGLVLSTLSSGVQLIHRPQRTAPMLAIQGVSETTTTRLELDEFADANECVRALREVLDGLGFAPESVRAALLEVAREP